MGTIIKIDAAVSVMRTFFQKKGFVEVYSLPARNILATRENLVPIVRYKYQGREWHQTGHLALEHILLDNPEIAGCYTVSDAATPMLEFESRGDMNELINMKKELLNHVGFEKKNLQSPFHVPFFDYPAGDYLDMMKKYNTKELDHDHMIEQDYGAVFFLKHFPMHTIPFWNVKNDGNLSSKVDVILHGIKTIESAERSCDKDDMLSRFLSINGGDYNRLLCNKFGKRVVEKHMDVFLGRDFIPRYGGGIRVTRMIRAMEMSDLI